MRRAVGTSDKGLREKGQPPNKGHTSGPQQHRSSLGLYLRAGENQMGERTALCKLVGTALSLQRFSGRLRVLDLEAKGLLTIVLNVNSLHQDNS